MVPEELDADAAAAQRYLWSALPQNLEVNVAEFAPRKALKLIA